MLSKMGWTEGQSLGKGGEGTTEPVSLVQSIKYCSSIDPIITTNI